MSDQEIQALRHAVARGDVEAELELERAGQRAGMTADLRADVYVVRVSSDSPGKFGRRRNRVAVMRMRPDAPRPVMISDRAKGCVEIVQTWERLNVGKTRRSAYYVALDEAIDLARSLGGGREPEVVE